MVDARGSLCAISLSFISGSDKTDSMRIILHLIALLSFIAIPLAESQTLTASPSPEESATPHKRVRKSKTIAAAPAATPTAIEVLRKKDPGLSFAQAYHQACEDDPGLLNGLTRHLIA